jgi:hypothetical protein
MIRVPRLKREACTYIMLRRKGYSINKLAKIFGRSTSMIHRILKTAGLTGYTIIGGPYDRRKSLHRLDMRKSGGIIASVEDLFRSKRTIKTFQGWLAFMEASEDKPP